MDLLKRVRPACWPGLLLLLAGGWAAIDAQHLEEYAVKAAFLYKFAGFVTWPDEGPAGPLCIGVAGQDPFGSVLDEVIKGRTIGGRPFVIRHFKPGFESPECQIVFIGSSEKKRLGAILELLRPGAVLTVGDMPGFCESGGVINFRVEDDRVRLEISIEAAGRARLQLSSKLLTVARIVGPGTR